MADSKTNRAAPRRSPKGERRREEIIAVAAEVYADAGYHGASLRQIAKRIGMTHAGLLYHFPNREALLAAVLERRDEQDSERVELRGPVWLGALGNLLELAEYNQRHPAIVELYVRLAAEAIAMEHPAHDYFTRHYANARTYAYSTFAALSEAGRLRPGVDPQTAAATFIALMDGLQVQWLTSPDEVDLAGPLRFLLEHLLTVPPD
jgi:AcrR family transcriptional regulator